MTTKTIKVNYYYPIKRNDNTGDEIVSDLNPIIQALEKIPREKRIKKDGDGNIQLKDIIHDDQNKRWSLCFLRNRVDAPFKTKLADDISTAEALDDDEFVGQECCMIYDEVSGVVALQNNRYSISCGGLTSFFRDYIKESFRISPITLKDKYCEISEETDIQYRSVIIGYTDITKLKELADSQDNEVVKFLVQIANNISAINGKIELGVGRTKNFLFKSNLKSIVSFFKENRGVTNTLKVKMLDEDTIRLIDLLNNKASDKFEISITKEDPKTFTKILNSMHSVFDVALNETFNKCNLLIK